MLLPATKSAHRDSQSAAPATKSAHRDSQSAAPATKSAHRDSQSAAPATQSAHRDSQSAAPATRSAHRDSQSAAPATKSAHRRSKTSKLHEAFANFEMRFRNAVPATKSCLQVIRNAALATQKHPQVQIPKMRPLSRIQPFHLKISHPSCGFPANAVLRMTHACQRFCNVHKTLRLPRNLQSLRFLAPAT